MSPQKRAQNKSQANKQMRHGDLFYRGSVLANLLPVEEATKAGSLSTLPSLKRSLRPSELSFLLNQPGTKLPRKGHHTIGASCFDYKCLITMKESRRKKAIQAQELERTQANHSL